MLTVNPVSSASRCSGAAATRVISIESSAANPISTARAPSRYLRGLRVLVEVAEHREGVHVAVRGALVQPGLAGDLRNTQRRSHPGERVEHRETPLEGLRDAGTIGRGRPGAQIVRACGRHVPDPRTMC